MKTRRPFFIVGTPRSGTTLLQSLFSTRPQLYISPETNFLPLTKCRERTNGPLATDVGLENNIRQIVGVCHQHELPVDVTALEQELRHCQRTYADLFDTLLWHIQSHRPNCQRVGEKSPSHLLFVPDLLAMFPDSQIVTIIRDGRDVALSQERAFGTDTLRAAIGWRRDQRLHARYARTFPADRYTSVRYEDLVNRPIEELRRLCQFLNEPFNETMLQFHERSERDFPDWQNYKAMTLKPLTGDRVGQYQTRWGRSKIALFQSVARRELVANGYQLESQSSWPGYLLAARQLPLALWSRIIWRRSTGLVPGSTAQETAKS